jgi:DNA-binding transcriptional MocR family regulator
MIGPWIKFYPSDWRADPALRMCSMGARGLWMEMLCIMHEAKPQGSLLVNGKQISLRQLASLCGCDLSEVESHLSELESAGVFSREEDGTIYSRRLRRDIEKAIKNKENGKLGGNPNLKGAANGGVNLPNNGGDKAQKPEARDQIGSSLCSEPSALAAPPKAKNRKSKISETAQPTETDRRVAVEYQLTDDEFRYEWRKFRDHHLAKATLFSDWAAAWRNWVRRTNEFRLARAGPSNGSKPSNLELALIELHEENYGSVSQQSPEDHSGQSIELDANEWQACG